MRSALSRRRFVLAGTGLVGAALLAACAAPAPPTPAPAGAQSAGAKPPAEAPKPGQAEPAKPAGPPAATTPAEAPKPAAAPATRPADATKPAAAGPKVLRLSTNAPPPNFNPIVAVSRTQGWTFNMIFSTLTQADAEKQDFAPELAESWKVAPDGSSYTFNLRKNAKWHDGKPVTARDVAYTYKMYLNPATGTKRSGGLALIKGAAAYTDGKAPDVAGIVVVDDQTIRFDQEFPNGLFLQQATLAILPEHVLGSIPPADLQKQKFFSEAPMGSGPFKFVKYVPDQFIEVEANPDFYFGKPKIDRIVFSIIKSPDTTEVAMDRGEIDMPLFDGGTATTAMYKKFAAEPRFKLVGTQGSTVIGYGWNFRKEYLKSPLVHQAFLHALDRRKLVERFNAGNGTIVNSFMVHPWYQRPDWANLYPYDPAKARALLKEANWDSSREVPVNVITLANEEIRAMVAAEQQMLAEVGFKITFREVELPVWVEKFYDIYDYELVRVTFGAFSDPDGFLNFHLKTGSKNAFGYANPELDKRIIEGQRTVDQAQRAKIYQEINEEMLKTLPVAPLYLENAWWMVSRRWRVGQLDALPAAADLTKVAVAKQLLGNSDVWKFHLEQWDLA
ncbi:MAG TPA: ABC transporter substrate-binding protein [Chloroflexota bacterium]